MASSDAVNLRRRVPLLEKLSGGDDVGDVDVFALVHDGAVALLLGFLEGGYQALVVGDFFFAG